MIARKSSSLLLPRVILLGTLVAGTLDLAYAFVIWAMKGVSPLRILQAVASGWLGEDAFYYGLASGLLGLVSHFAITMAMVAVYYLLARALRPRVLNRPCLFGPLYGVVLYGVMTHIVVPLSAANIATHPWQLTDLTDLAAHAWLVGLPCALTAKYAMSQASGGL